MDSTFRQTLKRRGHLLKPVILLGAHGLTDAVIAETGYALTAHELIKVRVRGMEREDRDAAMLKLCESTGAELVAQTGHIALIYRENPEKAKAPAIMPSRANHRTAPTRRGGPRPKSRS